MGPADYKNFFQVSKENEKEELKVLMGYSADAKLAPPMIVYSYTNNIPHNAIQAMGSVDPNWVHVYTCIYSCRPMQHISEEKSHLSKF